jgi:hypothetical protein
MMVEAEPIVRHNWLDIALHDKIKIEEASYDHVYVWVVTEIGSHLIPLYCELKQKQKIEGTQYTYISSCIYDFVTSNNLTRFCRLSDHSYYLVVKKRTLNGGDIIPVELKPFIEFISYGRWTWTDGVGVTYTVQPPA